MDEGQVHVLNFFSRIEKKACTVLVLRTSYGIHNNCDFFNNLEHKYQNLKVWHLVNAVLHVKLHFINEQIFLIPDFSKSSSWSTYFPVPIVALGMQKGSGHFTNFSQKT